jgi:putative ABC transport system permease protein
VRSAAICADLPYTDYGRGLALANPEGTARHEGRTVNVQEEPVSPDYFRTLGLPILAGRAFTEADDENGQDVAIITERMAQRWFPNRNPIGQRVKVGMPESDGPWLTIVGVARNLRTDPFHPGYGIIVFRPFRQAAPDSFSLLLRSANPSGVAGSAIQAVRALDPAQPVYDAMTLDAQFRIGLAPVRMISSLMAAFGFLALLLAATGVYSVMANAVAERTREIGIRVALGAARTRVVRSLVAESMRTAGLGIALGLPLAWLLAGLLQGMFFGVSASDPAAFTKAVSIVVASALLASFSAARRAAGIDKP